MTDRPTDARLLEVDDVVVRFGGIVALDGSLSISIRIRSSV